MSNAAIFKTAFLRQNKDTEREMLRYLIDRNLVIVTTDFKHLTREEIDAEIEKGPSWL